MSYVSKFKEGDTVRLKPDWLEIADPPVEKMNRWIKIGFIDALNARLCVDMEVLEVNNFLYVSYDLEAGRGLNFREEWLKGGLEC